jgi:hypothetical protein
VPIKAIEDGKSNCHVDDSTVQRRNKGNNGSHRKSDRLFCVENTCNCILKLKMFSLCMFDYFIEDIGVSVVYTLSSSLSSSSCHCYVYCFSQKNTSQVERFDNKCSFQLFYGWCKNLLICFEHNWSASKAIIRMSFYICNWATLFKA